MLPIWGALVWQGVILATLALAALLAWLNTTKDTPAFLFACLGWTAGALAIISLIGAVWAEWWG